MHGQANIRVEKSMWNETVREQTAHNVRIIKGGFWSLICVQFNKTAGIVQSVKLLGYCLDDGGEAL